MLTTEKLRQAQENDESIGYVLHLKLSETPKPKWSDISDKSADIKFWISRWDLLTVRTGLLCIKWEYSETDIRWRICIPKSVVPSVMWYIHDAHVSHAYQEIT